MGVQLSNNAVSTLAEDLSSVATSLTVLSGTGSLFPSLGVSDYFYLTVTSTANTFEIVKCTARVDDTFTITRAQEGTQALPFAAGSSAELRVTAGNVQSIVSDLNMLLL